MYIRIAGLTAAVTLGCQAPVTMNSHPMLAHHIIGRNARTLY
jgi:hypothetical protein